MPLGDAFEDVLAAAQAGAGWAFSHLYRELAGPVTGYLRLQGAADPDDVASETFLSVFRSLGTFAGGEDRFRSWVFTIAHRRLLDERRRRARRPVTVPLGPAIRTPVADGPEDEVSSRLIGEQLMGLLDDLSDGQRDVLLLRIVGGLTIEETAAALGKRPGAVKQLQRRGLLKIKEELSVRGVTL